MPWRSCAMNLVYVRNCAVVLTMCASECCDVMVIELIIVTINSVRRKIILTRIPV